MATHNDTGKSGELMACQYLKDNGYADLLTDEQRCEILRRLLQLEEYAKNVEAEIKGMIRVPSEGEAEEKMRKDLQRGRFDSDGVGSGVVL